MLETLPGFQNEPEIYKYFQRNPVMKSKTIQDIINFRDERNWKQFHNPKDLAISISLEAAEFLKYFSGAVRTPVPIHIWKRSERNWRTL